MNAKPVGWTALATLILTSVWLGLIIADMARAGLLDTYEQTFAHVGRLDALYYAVYLDAALLTVIVTMLMAGLYGLYRRATPAAALFGAVFVPVYATLNLVVYFSQMTVVPTLIAQQQTAPSPAVDVLLRQMIHTAPDSAAGFANALAYAALGISSLVFGVLMWRQGRAQRSNWPRAAGLLLALSGALSLAGFLSFFIDAPLLDVGLIAAGAVFWLALFPLSKLLLWESQSQNP